MAELVTFNLDTIRADFPSFGDFATAYIARFSRDKAVLGSNVQRVRLRMSSSRGGVELVWSTGSRSSP